MSHDLTPKQQAAAGRAIGELDRQLAGVETYKANLVAGEARVKACLAECKDTLEAIGVTGLPAGDVTQLHRELDKDGAWTGKVYINEPLPAPAKEEG